jgi:3'-5' exoribonuclease
MLTERCPLAEYRPGDRFEALLVAVRGVRAGVDKNNHSFADVKVADWSGSRSAKFWKITDAEINALFKAEFLEITGQVDASEKYSGDFTVNRYAIAITPDDITPFLENPPQNNREYRERFAKLVKSIGDRELRIVLRQVFAEEAFRRLFFRAFAANNVHHAFPGGLLQHTVEVAEMCSAACEIIPGLDRNLLVTGALLHDIGKMDEMNQDLRAGEYTDDGCLIGHIVLGASRVSDAVNRFNESAAPEDRVSTGALRGLVHLILSHHGLPEHGAAHKPAIAEAAVLYLCDNVSARSAQYLDMVEKNAVGATSVHNRLLDTQVYLKPVRTIPKSGQPEDDLPEAVESDPDFADSSLVRAVTLPILGLVAAGTPDDKAGGPEPERRRVIPPPEGADYLLHVVGESMLEANIEEGDLLFVRRTQSARDGDIVVAHVPGEGQTVKRFRLNAEKRNGVSGPYLEAASKSDCYKPIPLTDEARIQGKVTGLLRDL